MNIASQSWRLDGMDCCEFVGIGREGGDFLPPSMAWHGMILIPHGHGHWQAVVKLQKIEARMDAPCFRDSAGQYE